jgi:predicted patatin/cPLA2 family phospholipase
MVYHNADVRQPVMELLRLRRETASVPGERAERDTARLALVVQGGGMRGVISAAMLSALDDMGYKNSFDVIFGCSAGAMNAAYFLAGETWYPLSIYYDDLATEDFVNFLRPLRRRPILNLGYAFDDVIRRRKPLAADAAVASSIDFRVVVTALDPPEPLIVSDFSSGEDLISALRASCWLPIAMPGSADFRGFRAVDGGVLMPSMDRAAMEDGCTHILSLRTQPTNQTVARRRLATYYVRSRLNRLAAGLGDAYKEVHDIAPQAQMRKHSHSPRETPKREASILEIAPPMTGRVSRHEIDPFKLLTAARVSYGVMFATAEGRSIQDLDDGFLQVVPRLTPVVLSQAKEVVDG